MQEIEAQTTNSGQQRLRGAPASDWLADNVPGAIVMDICCFQPRRADLLHGLGLLPELSFPADPGEAPSGSAVVQWNRLHSMRGCTAHHSESLRVKKHAQQTVRTETD